MKKFFHIIITLLFFTIYSHCLFANKNPNQKLVLLLDWFANPNHAPLFVAQQKGFFKEQGLEVELIGPADPTDPPKLVAAGKADIGITYEPQFMQQVDHGLPLIRIGTLIDKPLDCVVVLKESAINSIKDLKGKRIGYSSGGMSSASLKVMLEKNGLTLKNVQLINVHYDLTQALLAKKVDAVSGMMRNFELIQLQLLNHPGLAFYPEQNGVPMYSELIFVVRNDRIHDPKFVKFLRALKKGIIYLQNHPEESWQSFNRTHRELNDELNRKAWFTTLPYFTNYPEKFDKKRWLDFALFMQQNSLIKKVQPIDMYAVDILSTNKH